MAENLDGLPINVIDSLPGRVRTRLALENTSTLYSATEIYEVCRAANIPMVLMPTIISAKEKLTSYDDSDIAHMLNLCTLHMG